MGPSVEWFTYSEHGQLDHFARRSPSDFDAGIETIRMKIAVGDLEPRVARVDLLSYHVQGGVKTLYDRLDVRISGEKSRRIAPHRRLCRLAQELHHSDLFCGCARARQGIKQALFGEWGFGHRRRRED